MIDYLKTILAKLLRQSLKILSLGRFFNNRVVFFSYFGKQYSCNPKYTSEYLSANCPQFDIVWAFDDPEKFDFLGARNIHIVKYNSLSFLRICLTSRYIITNSEIPSWLPIMKRQLFINTWHGGGAYKRVGSAYKKETAGKQSRAELARKNPCTYVSSSLAFTEMTLHQSFHHTGDIIASGMPRNDMLVCQNRDDLYTKVKSHYNIPEEHHILLYAPTYRDTKKASEYLLDCSRVRDALTQKFGRKWSILFRMHYFVMEQLDNSQEYIDASEYPDMQELLYVSDILITDYSSSMWDFALTEKPCFLYATDLSQYDLSRGFYTDIHAWPYILCETTEELVSNILLFSQTDYVASVKKHLNDLGNQETGHSAESIACYMQAHTTHK